MKIASVDPEYMHKGTNVYNTDIYNMGMQVGDAQMGQRIMIMYGDLEKPKYIHIVDESTGGRITIHFD